MLKLGDFCNQCINIDRSFKNFKTCFVLKKFMCCNVFLFLPLKVVTFHMADCIRVTRELIKITHSSTVKIKIMTEWNRGPGVYILTYLLFGQR